jgi:hypothetical protein
MSEDRWWLACSDPKPMLQHVRFDTTARKKRLFVVACCRRVWHLFTDERSRRAVEVSEQYADGLTDKPKLSAARAQADIVLTAAQEAYQGHREAYDAACRAANWDGSDPAVRTAASVAQRARASVMAANAAFLSARPDGSLRANNTAVVIAQAEGSYSNSWWSERAAQCHLLRDLVGNPYRPARLKRAWLTWNDGLLPKLARVIYDERAFDRLPILGDALEDAGCTNADLLAHCRESGDHARGCWVVDLLLGRA